MYSIFSRKLEINLFGSPSSAYLWKPRQRQTPEFLNVKTRWLNVLMATICVRLFSVEMYLLLTNIFPITLSGWDFLSVGSYLTQHQVPVRDPWRGAPSRGVKTRGSRSLSTCSSASSQLRLPLGEGNGTPLAASRGWQWTPCGERTSPRTSRLS